MMWPKRKRPADDSDDTDDVLAGALGAVLRLHGQPADKRARDGLLDLRIHEEHLREANRDQHPPGTMTIATQPDEDEQDRDANRDQHPPGTMTIAIQQDEDEQDRAGWHDNDWYEQEWYDDEHWQDQEVQVESEYWEWDEVTETWQYYQRVEQRWYKATWRWYLWWEPADAW